MKRSLFLNFFILSLVCPMAYAAQGLGSIGTYTLSDDGSSLAIATPQAPVTLNLRQKPLAEETGRLTLLGYLDAAHSSNQPFCFFLCKTDDGHSERGNALLRTDINLIPFKNPSVRYDIVAAYRVHADGKAFHFTPAEVESLKQQMTNPPTQTVVVHHPYPVPVIHRVPFAVPVDRPVPFAVPVPVAPPTRHQRRRATPAQTSNTPGRSSSQTSRASSATSPTSPVTRELQTVLASLTLEEQQSSVISAAPTLQEESTPSTATLHHVELSGHQQEEPPLPTTLRLQQDQADTASGNLTQAAAAATSETTTIASSSVPGTAETSLQEQEETEEVSAEEQAKREAKKQAKKEKRRQEQAAKEAQEQSNVKARKEAQERAEREAKQKQEEQAKQKRDAATAKKAQADTEKKEKEEAEKQKRKEQAERDRAAAQKASASGAKKQDRSKAAKGDDFEALLTQHAQAMKRDVQRAQEQSIAAAAATIAHKKAEEKHPRPQQRSTASALAALQIAAAAELDSDEEEMPTRPISDTISLEEIEALLNAGRLKEAKERLPNIAHLEVRHTVFVGDLYVNARYMLTAEEISAFIPKAIQFSHDKKIDKWYRTCLYFALSMHEKDVDKKQEFLDQCLSCDVEKQHTKAQAINYLRLLDRAASQERCTVKRHCIHEEAKEFAKAAQADGEECVEIAVLYLRSLVTAYQEKCNILKAGYTKGKDTIAEGIRKVYKRCTQTPVYDDEELAQINAVIPTDIIPADQRVHHHGAAAAV